MAMFRQLNRDGIKYYVFRRIVATMMIISREIFDQQRLPQF